MLTTLWEHFGDGPFLFQHDSAQRKVHKDVDERIWCGGTRLATESWPQTDRTPLGWAETVGQTFLPNISAWPHKKKNGQTFLINTLLNPVESIPRRAKAVIAAMGGPAPY